MLPTNVEMNMGGVGGELGKTETAYQVEGTIGDHTSQDII